MRKGIFPHGCVKMCHMEEIGVVKSIDGPYAKVLVPKRSVCDGCKQGTCNMTDDGAEIEALNTVKATVGQKVKVAMVPYTYVKGSLALYGVPAVALIAGAVAGKEFFSGYFPGSDPELVAAGFAFGAMVISFLIVKVISTALGGKQRERPIIEEIL